MPITRVIDIGQNETGFMSSGLSDTAAFLTVALTNCVGVVFQDSKGNLSFTHADARTDMGFLRREAARMQGSFTIDLIRHSDGGSSLAIHISNCINAWLGDIKNSRNNRNVRTSHTGTVLVSKNYLAAPSYSQTDELRRGQCSVNNPLAGCVMDTGRDILLRNVHGYMRLLANMFDPELVLPSLIFEDGWTGNWPEVSTAVRNILNHLQTMQSPEAISAYLAQCAVLAVGIAHVNANPYFFSGLSKDVDEYKLRCKQYHESIHRVTTNFFHQSPTKVSQAAIKLIADYVEEKFEPKSLI